MLQDPDECRDDKKASLLMMNFTMEEVDFAMNKLGIILNHAKPIYHFIFFFYCDPKVIVGSSLNTNTS